MRAVTRNRTAMNSKGPVPAGAADPTSTRRAQLDDDIRSTLATGTTTGVLKPVAVVLTIGLIFVAVYLAAFHAPQPHHLPVAVVGTGQQTQTVRTELGRSMPGGFTVTRLADGDDAREALQQRRIYAALETHGDARMLLYAGANGPAVTSLLTSVLSRDSRERISMQDVVPAAAGDTRGLSIFYAAFGVILAGFLFGTLTYQVAPRLALRARLLSLAMFGVAGGTLVVAIAKAYGAMPGPFWTLAAVIALMAGAAGGASMTLIRLLGGAGVSVGSVVLLVLGNSTSGGSLPRDFLPVWLRPLSEVLPVGVGVRALNGLAYFHHDGLRTGLIVLLGWIAVCVAALYVEDTVGAHRAREGAPTPGPTGPRFPPESPAAEVRRQASYSPSTRQPMSS